MIKNAIDGLTVATRGLLQSWQTPALFAGLYASLLATLYFFAATREATRWQVLLTLALATVAPVLFFVLQAMSVQYTENRAAPNILLRRSLRDFWKLLLISLPLLLLAWIIAYLQNKYLMTVPGKIREDVSPWPLVLLTTLRCLIFGVVLPLAAIHLWIVTARDGLKAAFRSARRILVRAYAPQSVFIYTVGMVIFGIIPYLLLFTRTPASSAWIELGLFNLRLALAFVLTLLGWVITLGALNGGRRDE